MLQNLRMNNAYLWLSESVITMVHCFQTYHRLDYLKKSYKRRDHICKSYIDNYNWEIKLTQQSILKN